MEAQRLPGHRTDGWRCQGWTSGGLPMFPATAWHHLRKCPHFHILPLLQGPSFHYEKNSPGFYSPGGLHCLYHPASFSIVSLLHQWICGSQPVHMPKDNKNLLLWATATFQAVFFLLLSSAIFLSWRLYFMPCFPLHIPLQSGPL